MRGGLQGVLSAQSQRDLHTTLCIHCREQLPALVTAAAPPVTLSYSPGSLRDRVLDPSLLWGPPGCGTENVGQRHRSRLCQAGVWVMLLHPRADKLPCPEMPRRGSWHSQASSQLPALSHPSLGRGSGNAAAFSGCLDFWGFFTLLFSWNP